MSKYPTINYIGNKDKLTNWIMDNMPVKEGLVLDLFCGGCSVSYALKEKGYTVHSNDVLYSNYVLAKMLIENKNKKLNIAKIEENLIDVDFQKYKKETKFLANKIYFSEETEELAKLIALSETFKGYEKYIFLSLLRRAMIRKIPYSRMNVKWEEIKKLRDEDYSYKKYGRYRHYHNVPFLEHIKENLDEYNDAVFNNNRNNKAFQKDCYSLLKNTKEKYDVIYIDPPYPSTMNKYNEFYGYFDKMLNKEIKYSDLTDKKEFLNKFEKLIQLCKLKSNYVIISINESVKPTPEEISEMLNKYGTITIKKKQHQYKVTGKTQKNRSKEILIILKF